MTDAPLMLSISGLRGIVGQSLTPELAARYGAAVGSWLKARTGKNNPKLVLGRDSRPSGEMIENAVIAGLIATGCAVTRLGIVSTPGVGIMVKHHQADAGMVITASHNPVPWNGIKVLTDEGLAPPPAQANQIIQRFNDNDLDYVDAEHCPATGSDDSTHQIHVRKVLDQVDVKAIANTGMKVVIDSVCGAGGPGTALLIQQLGLQPIHLNAEPTGLFPHPPEPTRTNLTSLCHAVKAHDAAIGLAQDPDADRLAIVDENGHYIGEEYTMVLAAMNVLSKTPGPVAANLSTSRMIDDLAAEFGQQVTRTAVGEANVVNGMKQVNAVLGGEGNGGVILPQVTWVRDSFTGIALVLELMATTGKTVSQLVAQVPAYAMIKDKLPIAAGMAQTIQQQMTEQFADQQLDTQDGVRIDWPDRWVHVRASNTEPILRIIAEAPSEKEAASIVNKMRNFL